MAPGRTVMDLVCSGLSHSLRIPTFKICKSLALALYFASRGQGQVRSVGVSPEPYHSQARVVLSGLGSDELLGGYGRHRTVYGTSGWKAVIDEVNIYCIPQSFLTTFLNQTCSCNRKSIAFLLEIWDEMTESFQLTEKRRDIHSSL